MGREGPAGITAPAGIRAPAGVATPAGTTGPRAAGGATAAVAEDGEDKRKGREKVNDQIKVLKTLLPEVNNNPIAAKVSILQSAVTALRTKNDICNSLLAEIAHLREENERLKAKIKQFEDPFLPPSYSFLPHYPPSHVNSMLDPKRHDGYTFPKISSFSSPHGSSPFAQQRHTW